MVSIYNAKGEFVEQITREEAERREVERVRNMPTEVLKYFAPMQCGGRERAELVRRAKEAGK